MNNINYYYDKDSEKWIIKLEGEIDIYTAPQLKKVLYSLFDQKLADLSLECSQLNYMDSTGLGVLIGILKKMKEYEKKIYIKNLKTNIKKLFNITGLDNIFILEG